MTVVTVGETMALLDAPATGRLGGALPVRIGGAESNVAIGLARLGVDCGWVSRVGDEGRGLPPSVSALTNVNFHCSPAASVRPDGTYAVEAVTATASFRFGKSMTRWFERSGAKVIVGKAGLTELAYREWFVPYGSVYLTTIGYGMGAAYGQCIKGVRAIMDLARRRQ